MHHDDDSPQIISFSVWHTAKVSFASERFIAFMQMKENLFQRLWRHTKRIIKSVGGEERRRNSIKAKILERHTF